MGYAVLIWTTLAVPMSILGILCLALVRVLSRYGMRFAYRYRRIAERLVGLNILFVGDLS